MDYELSWSCGDDWHESLVHQFFNVIYVYIFNMKTYSIFKNWIQLMWHVKLKVRVNQFQFWMYSYNIPVISTNIPMHKLYTIILYKVNGQCKTDVIQYNPKIKRCVATSYIKKKRSQNEQYWCSNDVRPFLNKLYIIRKNIRQSTILC
jgi:hypothetical protein